MNILKRINDLKNKIHKHNVNYYVKDSPTILDHDYDELLRDSNRGYGGATYDIVFTGYCKRPDGTIENCEFVDWGENGEWDEGEPAVPASFIPNEAAAEYDGLGVPTKFYVDDLFWEYGNV